MGEKLRRICAVEIILLVVLMVCVPYVHAEESETGPEPETKRLFPGVYVHGGFGMGIARHDEKEILASIGDDFEMATGSIFLSYGVYAGISNIAQYEYRKNCADHNISTTDTDFSDGWSNPKFTRTKVEMGHESWDKVVKVNPFFWTWKKSLSKTEISSRNYFILFGKGKAEYFDDVGDGYEGDSKILGLEVIHMSKYVTFGYNFKKYMYDYTDNYIGAGDTYKANNWHLQAFITIGLGI